MKSKNLRELSIKDLIPKFKAASKQEENKARNLRKKISPSTIAKKIMDSNNIQEIAELFTVIRFYDKDYSQNVLGKVGQEVLIQKILATKKLADIVGLLETIGFTSFNTTTDILERISNGKCLEFIVETSDFSPRFEFLRILKIYNEAKINAIIDSLESIFESDINNAISANDIVETFCTAQFLSGDFGLKILNKVTLDRFAELIRNDKSDIEVISGTISAVGDLSVEYARKLIEKLDSEIIETMKIGEGIGDVSDFLEVFNDISDDIALHYLEKISIDSLGMKIRNEQSIDEITWLIEILSDFAEEQTKKLLEKIGAKVFIQKINASKDNSSILALISSIEFASNIFLDKIAEEIDVDYYKRTERVFMHTTDY